jgi:probable addiction module antidote protein
MLKMSESSETSLFRDNPAEIARFLTAVLAKDDFPALLAALSLILRAQNVSALSRATGLRRDRLYVTFDGVIEPDFKRVLKLLEGLDVQLKVVPRENPKPKPQLPKLGRPRSFKENDTDQYGG